MWYLLNEYYLCIHFEPRFYAYTFLHDNKYFNKFWHEILKNDAHDGQWSKYHKADHPRFGQKITSACIVAKLNSKNNVQAEGIVHPPDVHWVTNADGTIHRHTDVSWISCHYSLSMAESLNQGIFPEIVPADPDVCRQQWPYQHHWEMPSPFDFDDPYYHNHDPDADIDEEWFQGRDD